MRIAFIALASAAVVAGCAKCIKTLLGQSIK
jgi:hypothetical protein